MIEILTGKRKASKFSEIDPRVRIVWLFTVSGLAMLWTNIIPLLIVILSLIPVWIYSDDLKGSLISSIKLLPYLIFLFVFQVAIKFLFSGLSDPYLFHFWQMDISFQEIHKAFIETVRLYVMIQSAQVFFKTTDFGELTSGIRHSFSCKNKQVKKSKEILAFLLGTAFQSVPLLDREIKQIVEVQKARGVQIDKGSKIQQVRKLSRMGMPIFIRSLDLIKDSGLALLNFGFDINEERSSYRALKMQSKDWFFLGTLVLTLVLNGFIKFIVPDL
jgi:energy-coupling factor transport system permease protein